jgi:hypothetical protein
MAIADRCYMLMRAFAKLGIVALVEALIILLRPWVDAEQGQAQAADDGS